MAMLADGPFLFRCPTTQLRVQGWSADDMSSGSKDETYETVTCVACQQVHLVDPATGKVIGAEEFGAEE